MRTLRIVFLGNGERACVCLEALARCDHEISLVVSLPDERQPGWSRNLTRVAEKLGLPGLQPDDINAPGSVAAMAAARPDLLVLAGYNQLLKAAARAVPSLCCINLHASPLPAYRGAAPMNWMLINGETRGGISILKVDDGIDTGDILGQHFFDIGPETTYADLVDVTLREYPPMLLQVVERIADGSIQAEAQNREDGFFCTRRHPKDGRIDWRGRTAEQVRNLVRALSAPAPGAFTHSGDGPIMVERARHCARTYLGVPGRVAARLGDSVVVICQDKGLEITHVRNGDGTVSPAAGAFPPTGTDLDERG